MLMAIRDGLEIIEKFIGLGKELAKLPALVLPQYADAARDLYEICRKLLDANENTMRWFNKFRYFDFQDPVARASFLAAVQEYQGLKAGTGFKQLKFSCSDIAQIYYRSIASKLGNWLTDQQKLEEAEGIFSKITDADREMVRFVQESVLESIDKFVAAAEPLVDTGNLPEAEKLRLEFKLATADLTPTLEFFGNELSDLTITFAGIARVPITLT